MASKSAVAAFISLVVVSSVAACGSDDGASGDDVEGVVWTLTEMDGQSLPAEAVVTLEYDGESVAGTSACNQYNGAAAFGDGEVTFPSAFMSTMMACVDPLMQVEADYLATLAEVTGFEVTDDTLTLTNAEGVAVLVFSGA